MPCKTLVNCREENKAKYACIVGAYESKRIRVEGSLSKNHEDHISGKCMKSLSHYNLVHRFMPMLEALKIPDAKAAVEKQWEKLRNTGMAADESQKRK